MYMIERGSRLESEVNLLYKKRNWIEGDGIFLQRWTLQVVYTEIAYPAPRLLRS